jgi:hypothetical protein
MSDISALITRLVDQGVDPAEAAEVIALAMVAGVATAPYRKSPGALRTEKWRGMGARDRQEISNRQKRGVDVIRVRA